MKYIKDEIYDKYYRQVDAMCHKGYDNASIRKRIPLPDFIVDKMINKVFGLEQIRKESKRVY